MSGLSCVLEESFVILRAGGVPNISVGPVVFWDRHQPSVRGEPVEPQQHGSQSSQRVVVYRELSVGRPNASVIATVFGQLADEGRIDADAKPIAEIALRRQIIFAELSTQWTHRHERIGNLQRLLEVLANAD